MCANRRPAHLSTYKSAFEGAFLSVWMSGFEQGGMCFERAGDLASISTGDDGLSRLAGFQLLGAVLLFLVALTSSEEKGVSSPVGKGHGAYTRRIRQTAPAIRNLPFGSQAQAKRASLKPRAIHTSFWSHDGHSLVHAGSPFRVEKSPPELLAKSSRGLRHRAKQPDRRARFYPTTWASACGN